MQFAKILTLAAGVSAAALNTRNSGSDCNSIGACEQGGKWGKCSDFGSCEASGGNPYCCSTVGLLNVLNCVNILNGNTIEISALNL